MSEKMPFYRRAILTSLATVIAVGLVYAGFGTVLRWRFGSPWQGDREPPRAQRIEEAVLEYALAYRRDSLLRARPDGREVAPGVAAVVDPHLPPEISGPILTALAATWRRVGSASDGTPVVIALFADTAAAIYGVPTVVLRRSSHPNVGVVVPERAQTPCIVTLSFSRLPSAEQLKDWSGVERSVAAMGVCAFFHRFGPPGAGVRSWLVRTRYEAAGEANWWTAKPKFRRPYAQIRREAGFALDLRSDPFERIELLPCAAGDIASCERLVTTPRMKTGLPAGFGVLADEQPGLLIGQRVDRHLGFFGGTKWLSDQLRDFGEERFARFWRSPKPMPDAFAEAFGTPIGESMRSRIAGDYEAIERGAAVSSRTALLTLLLGAILLAAAIANARGWELR